MSIISIREVKRRLYALTVWFGRGAPRSVCLVTGCPRSGTSAVLKWLGVDPGAAVMFEDRIAMAVHGFLSVVDVYEKLYTRKSELLALLRDLVQCDASARQTLRGRVLILKEPVPATTREGMDFEKVIAHLGELFPSMQVIFMVRHPVAVVNSMLKRTWGASLHGVEPRRLTVEECIATWKTSADIMMTGGVSRSYVCRYENLLADPESESQAIRDLLGLKKLDDFTPRTPKRVELEDDVIERVLAATEKERRFFGYDASVHTGQAAGP